MVRRRISDPSRCWPIADGQDLGAEGSRSKSAPAVRSLGAASQVRSLGSFLVAVFISFFQSPIRRRHTHDGPVIFYRVQTRRDPSPRSPSIQPPLSALALLLGAARIDSAVPCRLIPYLASRSFSSFGISIDAHVCTVCPAPSFPSLCRPISRLIMAFFHNQLPQTPTPLPNHPRCPRCPKSPRPPTPTRPSALLFCCEPNSRSAAAW